MLLYSKQFFADRASLLMLDLGIDEQYKPVIQKYIKFFRAKDRTQRFYDLALDKFDKETIEVALMSVLCKAKVPSFEAVLRVVLTGDGLEDNRFLDEFNKYDLLEAFWRLCDEQFGYNDATPKLEKLVITLFVTYTQRSVQADLPNAWKRFISYKSGNIIAFLDHLMNNILYREPYDALSADVSKTLQVQSVLSRYNPEALLTCDSFAEVDELIIDWINDRLLNEDTGAGLNNLSIPEICQERRKKHFSERYETVYRLLESAFHLILAGGYRVKRL